jgi:hypothetical protein
VKSRRDPRPIEELILAALSRWGEPCTRGGLRMFESLATVPSATVQAALDRLVAAGTIRAVPAYHRQGEHGRAPRLRAGAAPADELAGPESERRP